MDNLGCPVGGLVQWRFNLVAYSSSAGTPTISHAWSGEFETASRDRQTLHTVALLASVSALEVYERFVPLVAYFESSPGERDAFEALERHLPSAWAWYPKATLGTLDLDDANNAIRDASWPRSEWCAKSFLAMPAVLG